VEGARARWTLAPLVLVGAESASAVAAAGLPRRRDVVLVSGTPTAETWQNAVEVGAEHVVALPDGERWLIDRLADTGEGPGRAGRVVAVVGTGAGAGASTFAATVAMVAAAQGLQVLLVDADATAGGLDVLLGLEDVPGIRWPDLAESRGRLAAGSLAAALPAVGGVTVLSCGRTGPALIAPEGMSAVLDAGIRAFDVVVVDVPRQPGPVGDLILARADETMLVASNRVRGVAACARLARILESRCNALSIVVRAETRTDDSVLHALGIPVVALLPTAGAVARRAEDGEPPSTRDAYARACLAALRSVASTIGRAA
jgi:secretion/DNA translocation related CpaE-like protein